jgi:hypothetical protein
VTRPVTRLSAISAAQARYSLAFAGAQLRNPGRRAPGRVAAIGLRQMLEPCGPRTLPRSECVHGVPVVRAPNGMELLPALRAAAGIEPPRPGVASNWFLRSAERGNDVTRLRAWTEG